MLTLINNGHRAVRIPLSRGGFIIVQPGGAARGNFRLPSDLSGWEAAGIQIEDETTMILTNRHDAPLSLPLAGPVLVPGVPTKVKRWSVIKGHPVVRSWVAAGVLVVNEDDSAARLQTGENASPVFIAEEVPVAAPEAPQAAKQTDPLDHDGDGKKGGSKPAIDDPVREELKAQAKELGIAIHWRWSNEKIEQAINAKLAE